MSYSDMRREYSLSTLGEKTLAKDPLKQFEKWFQEAGAAKLAEPNAMVCSLASRDGTPSSRMVLLKGMDARGFVFYTNYESRKGRALADNPRISLLFPWFAMERQVIVEGTAARLPREESEAYFHSRPRASQLGAWASPQSSIVTNRSVLDDALKSLDKKYAGVEIPMPPHWGGYRVTPETVEFWQGRRNRLHDRLRYRRETGGAWVVERLAP